MDSLCNVEQQQIASQKKLVTGNAASASEDLQYSHENARNVQKSLPSLLDQFLASGNENKQHTIHKNTRGSVINEASIENRLANTVGEAIAQHCERDFTSIDSKSKGEDITLASLLGYPKVTKNFETRNNGTSQITTACSSRHVRMQQSLHGVEINVGTETAHLPFNDSADKHQTSYAHDLMAVSDNGECLRDGEGNEVFYNNGRESDNEENTQWWFDSERVHMGDVHRAVSEFLSGNTGYGSETLTTKAEFVANEFESVEPNNLESCDILDSAFKALVGSDSVAVNESCRIKDSHSENVPIFLLSDDSDALSEGNETFRPTPSVDSSRERMRLDVVSVNSRGLEISNGDVTDMYTCNICDKVFSRLDSVQDHVRMHLVMRPYICVKAKCGKTFTSADKFNLHVRNGHARPSNTTYRPSVIYFRDPVTDVSVLNEDAPTKPNNNKLLEVFPCSKCDKEFKDSNSLLKHTISHNKTKSRSCNCQCGEIFLTYYAKRKHWRDINSSCYKPKKRSYVYRPNPVQTKSHAQKRNKVSRVSKKKCYQCKECEEKFTKERQLTDHVCFGTGADLYTCDTCSETFVQRATLTRHLKSHCVA